MRDTNKYDGNQVVIHTIKQGETLSSIAHRYHFKSWTPIWTYNSQVRPVLNGSPDNVPAGASIFIPRSEEGYNRLIKKFQALAWEMQYSGDRETYSLESEYYRHQADRVLLNAVGDVFTTIATIGLQARKAAQMLSAAEKVTGSGRVAAEYLASKESEKVVETLKGGVVDKLEDLAADKASSKLSDKGKENFDKAYKAGAKTAPKTVKAVRGFSLLGGKAILDLSEIVLQYFEPATVADLWLAHVTGGTPQSAYENAREQIANAVTNSCTRLHQKTLQIESERNLLYSSKRSAA